MKVQSPGAPQPAWTHRFPCMGRMWGAGSQMWFRLCPRDPSCAMLCAQPCRPCLAALSLFPGKLGSPRREPGGEGPGEGLCCSDTSSWKLSGSWDCAEGQRDRAHMALLQGPAWLAGAVMVEKQPGRWQQGGAAEQPLPRGEAGNRPHPWCGSGPPCNRAAACPMDPSACGAPAAAQPPPRLVPFVSKEALQSFLQ